MINLKLQQRAFDIITITTMTMVGKIFFAAIPISLSMLYSNLLFHWIATITGAAIYRFLYTIFFETFTFGKEFNSYRKINIVIAFLTMFGFYYGVYATLVSIQAAYVKVIGRWKGNKKSKEYRSNVPREPAPTAPEESVFYDARSSSPEQRKRRRSSASSGIRQRTTRKRTRPGFGTATSIKRQQQQQQQFARHPSSVSIYQQIGTPPSTVTDNDNPNLSIPKQQQQQQIIFPRLYYPDSLSQEFVPVGAVDAAPTMVSQPSFSATQQQQFTASRVPHYHQQEPIIVPVSNMAEHTVYPYSFSCSEDKYECNRNEEEFNKSFFENIRTKPVMTAVKNIAVAAAAAATSTEKMKPVVYATKLAGRKRLPVATKYWNNTQRGKSAAVCTGATSKSTKNNNNKRSRDIPHQIDEVVESSEIPPRPSKRQRRVAAKANAQQWANRTFR